MKANLKINHIHHMTHKLWVSLLSGCVILLLCSSFGANPRAQSTTQDSEVAKLIVTAAQHVVKGNYDEGLKLARKAVELDPKNVDAHFIVGLAQMRKGDTQQAFDRFEVAIKLNPPPEKLKNYYSLKAAMAAKLNKVDEAIELCKKALEIDPNFADAYGTLGAALEIAGNRNTEAITAYLAVVKLTSKFPHTFERIETLLHSITKDDQFVEKSLRELMAADPKHMAGRFSLGRLLVKQGKLTEARELWEGRSSDTDNTSPSLIQVLTRAENLKSATAKLAQTPNDPEALNSMGVALLDNDHWVFDDRQKRAIVYFRKALDLRPEYKDAQANLVKALIEDQANKKLISDEMARLRSLDPEKAKEMEEYQKTYVRGIRGILIR